MSLILLILLLGLPSLASAQTGNEEAICRNDANVFFCENWEDRPLGFTANFGSSMILPQQFKNQRWLMDTANAGSIVTGNAFDGAKSLRLITPANQVSSGGTQTLDVMGNATEWYWRIMLKYESGYIWSPVATKALETVINSTNNSTCCGFFNSTSSPGINTPKATSIASEGPPLVVAEWFQNDNLPALQWVTNQWYCLEIHNKQNVPESASNGVLEMWIQRMGVDPAPVRRWNYSGILLNNNHGGDNSLRSIFLPTYWNCDQNESCAAAQYQHPNLTRYIDSIIVSRARIGCPGGSPPPPPPPPPTNFKVTTQ
jgi:hypothetical protein